MPDDAAPPTVTSGDIYTRIRAAYPFEKGWITMGEVQPHGTSRRFDALAIMGWGSRGFEAVGFEIKVSRGDWLKELKDPSKADPLVSLCTRWWVCAPPGVVQAAELPESWGLLVFHSGQTRAAKQAPKLSPAPWPPEMWRCMLLRLADRKRYEPTEISAARDDGFNRGYEAGEKSAKWKIENAEENSARLAAIIDKAQKATGVNLHGWVDYEDLGAAMKVLRNGKLGGLAFHMRELAGALEALGEKLGVAKEAAE